MKPIASGLQRFTARISSSLRIPQIFILYCSFRCSLRSSFKFSSVFVYFFANAAVESLASVLDMSIKIFYLTNMFLSFEYIPVS